MVGPEWGRSTSAAAHDDDAEETDHVDGGGTKESCRVALSSC